MHADIQNAEDLMGAYRKHWNSTIARVQEDCKHEELAEADYVASTDYSYARPPTRVCLNCGMAEDGWGCGNLALRGHTRPITRDEFYKLWRGLRISREMQGPLIRKETTVAQLVRDWHKSTLPKETP